MSADLAFMNAIELGAAIRSGEVSSVEATENFFQRIERLDPQLNSYLALCQDQALADARAADEAVRRGDATGQLHGIPISIKDLEMTKGVPTTLGSALFQGRVPDVDSIVVERVKAAGAVVLGKTNTPEFGQSGTTENKLGEPCRNPWNTERTSGGSSGGAGAAVAAGLCTIATGSDGGGSVRIPASFNGIFGIKPSQGRVPRYGGYGRPAANHFSQSGPMTRTVADCALLLQVMAGPDSRDANSIRQAPPDFSAGLNEGVSGMRIAWSPDFGYAAVDPEVASVTAGAARLFEELGASVEEPDLAMEDPFPAFWDVFATAAYTSYGHLLEEHRGRFHLLRPSFHRTRGGGYRRRSVQGLVMGRPAGTPIGGLLRSLRPAGLADHGRAGVPHRTAPDHDRREAGGGFLGVPALHLSHQHDRSKRRPASLAAFPRTACPSDCTSSVPGGLKPRCSRHRRLSSRSGRGRTGGLR